MGLGHISGGPAHKKVNLCSQILTCLNLSKHQHFERRFGPLTSLPGDILRERADISIAPHVEQGRLKKFYFHASNFNPRPSNKSKIFHCFVNDEIHQLQANLPQPSDLFDALKRGNFSVDRSLLDMVLEHLISTWKGAVPAPVTVLAFAFMTGAYIHRDRDFDVGAMYKRNEKAKDRERPLSLIVCRWIVQQWSHEM